MNNLSSHDGLHDALTGALTLAAFYEAAAREIARAKRISMPLHLLLLNLPSTERVGTSNLQKKSIEDEERLVQLVEMVHELKNSLRDHDLISRTGLGEISIIFSGNADDVHKRLLDLVQKFSAIVAIVQYQEHWELSQFLTAGDRALEGIARSTK